MGAIPKIFDESNDGLVPEHVEPTLDWRKCHLIKSIPTPAQQVSFQKLPKNKSFLLLDNTGVGKTFSILGSFALLRQHDSKLKLVVLCTKTGLGTWLSEINTHTTLSSVGLSISNRNIDLPESFESFISSDVFVLTYSSILHFPNILNKIFREYDVAFAVDECHRISDSTTAQSERAYYLRSHSMFSWGATATLMLNHIEDVYGTVNFFFPGYLGRTEDIFLKAFTVRTKKMLWVKRRLKNGSIKPVRRPVKEIVGYKNIDVLRDRLRPLYLKRSLKFDIRFHYNRFSITESEEENYLLAAKGLLGKTEKQFAARLHDLQRAANGCYENPNSLTTKEIELSKLLIDYLGKNEPVIIFTGYRTTLDRLTSLLKFPGAFPNLKNVYNITGDTPQESRTRLETEFYPGDVVIMTPAGGESLNLHASRTIIFFDTPFPLGQIIQTIGRIARLSSKWPYLNVHFLRASGTIDDYKELLVASNTQLMNDILGGNANLPPVTEKVPLELIKEMRKELLWRTKKSK